MGDSSMVELVGEAIGWANLGACISTGVSL